MTKNDDTRPLTAGGFSPVSGGSAEALKPSGFQPLDPGKRPERTPVWPKIIVGVIGLTVAGLLFFLLTARSLEVQVDAIGSATIDIDGINVPLGKRYLIRPGQYLVTVKVPGYRDWQQEAVVTDADSQQLVVTPAILPGSVSLLTAPPRS